MSPMIVMLGIACQATAGTTEEPGRAGRLVLVAGGGIDDFGTATQVELIAPFGVAFDAEGTLFFVELTGQRVRKIGPDGLVTTLAGTGRKGDRGDDGPATKAELNGPHGLVVTR